MSYTGFRVAPISGALGAEVFGIDLSTDLDEAAMDEIRRALAEYVVLLFRDQDLSVASQRAFAGRLGKLIPHPYVTGSTRIPTSSRSCASRAKPIAGTTTTTPT